MEEGSTRINADRKGKERQAQRAQLLGHLQFDPVGLGPGCHDDGEKENGSGAQADALDLDFAEGHADADKEEQEQHRLFVQYLEDLDHDVISVRVLMVCATNQLNQFQVLCLSVHRPRWRGHTEGPHNEIVKSAWRCRVTVLACSTFVRLESAPWSWYPGVRCLPRNERMDRTPIPRIRANARN